MNETLYTVIYEVREENSDYAIIKTELIYASSLDTAWEMVKESEEIQHTETAIPYKLTLKAIYLP